MITKFESYEPDEDDLDNEKAIYTDAGYYIESQFPKEDFVDWEYGNVMSNNPTYISYTFYFDEDSDEDVIIQIDDFLSQHNIDYETSYGKSWRTDYDSESKKYFVLKFNVPLDLVNYFGELYSEITKYNL